ncbi:MAG: hypothetical protein ABIH41_02750 [Nanoarchaeota archaeon]
MVEINTERFTVGITERKDSGPAGYESTYLTGVGELVSDRMYTVLQSLNGEMPGAAAKVLRHRNLGSLVDAIEQGRRVGLVSGFKPSGAYHFGHKLASSAVSHFQRNGIGVYVPVADVECDNDRKLSRDQYMLWAADNLLDWGANGVDLDAAHVYLQSQEHRVDDVAKRLWSHMDFGLALDVYGPKFFDQIPSLHSGVTQSADILLPQHSDFRNDTSFMMSGPDQDGHMNVTLELVRRAFGEGTPLCGVKTQPSSIYIPHIRGLGGGKASSSNPTETIYLGSGPDSLDLQTRIDLAQRKLKESQELNPQGLMRSALDMIRYTDVFSTLSDVDLNAAYKSEQYVSLLDEMQRVSGKDGQLAIQHRIDGFLDAYCRQRGQVNVDLITRTIPDVLAQHAQRRSDVMSYAIARAESGDGVDLRPSFWETPEQGYVPDEKATPTRWYHIVADASDRLRP